MSSFKLPTETIELPSKGLIYPEGNPLSSGQIEMKYMTAKEEDIMSNANYIQQGVVVDKLLQSLIISNISYDDLIIGDKNALLVAARILGYGKDYSFSWRNETVTVDLSQIESKELNESLYTKGKNEFDFELPSTGTKLTFKLLTHKDERNITKDLEGFKKSGKESPEFTTRLKYSILSIEGNTDRKFISEFVDEYMLARDARAFREYAQNIQPDIDLTFFPPSGTEKQPIPIGVKFLWPDV